MGGIMIGWGPRFSVDGSWTNLPLISRPWFFSLFHPPLKPFLEGSLAFSRGPPEENVLHADIFIHVRPMDALAFADQPPVVPFFPAAVQQAWIPGNRL